MKKSVELGSQAVLPTLLTQAKPSSKHKNQWFAVRTLFIETGLKEKRTACAHTSRPPNNWLISGICVLSGLVF
jgi:hypothetical protein